MANLYHDLSHNSIDDLRDSLTLGNIVTIRINYAAFSDSYWAHHTRRLREYAGFCSKRYSRNDDVTIPGIFDCHDILATFKHLSEKTSYYFAGLGLRCDVYWSGLGQLRYCAKLGLLVPVVFILAESFVLLGLFALHGLALPFLNLHMPTGNLIFLLRLSILLTSLAFPKLLRHFAYFVFEGL